MLEPELQLGHLDLVSERRADHDGDDDGDDRQRDDDDLGRAEALGVDRSGKLFGDGRERRRRRS